MNKTVIINRPISDSELNEIKRLAEGGATIFTLSGGNVLDFAQQITLSPEGKKSINYETMDEVLRFGDLPVDGQTVADLFRIDTASVWHYHKFRVYFEVCNLMFFLKPLEQHFNSFSGHIWFVSPEVKPLLNLYPDVEFRFPAEKTKAKLNFGNLFSYVILVTYRFLNYLLTAKKNPEYLLYVTENYSKVLNKNSLKISFGHNVLEYLISELDERFALLTEALMPKLKGKSDYSFSWKQYQTSWNDNPKIFIEGFLVTGLLNGGVRKSIETAKKQIKSAYLRVYEMELSPVQKLMFEVFQSFDKSSGFFLFRYFAARNYFRNSKLKALIASDENSPLSKSILDAAKFYGIKIIGLQHGTIHDLHPAFLYTPNDRRNQIMPDLTLTWGKNSEEFLVAKGNYPKESVVSVGQIRTDIIPVLLKSEKREETHQQQRIVFASQPQRDPELRYQAAYDVFKAASNLPASNFIVKLHHREFMDCAYYDAIAKEVGCTNYILNTSSDLYQLIASCDVLITCFSTVGTETVYFYKPLVILDHLKQDIQGYVAEGVAFQATNAENLTNILSAILSGNLQVDRAKYDSFIQKYVFRIDGKVAERCIEEITCYSNAQPNS